MVDTYALCLLGQEFSARTSKSTEYSKFVLLLEQGKQE